MTMEMSTRVCVAGSEDLLFGAESKSKELKCCSTCGRTESDAASSEAILSAARDGDDHFIRHAVTVLRSGIMDVTDEDGMTALHVASQKGHLPVLKFLLSIPIPHPSSDNIHRSRHSDKENLTNSDHADNGSNDRTAAPLLNLKRIRCPTDSFSSCISLPPSTSSMLLSQNENRADKSASTSTTGSSRKTSGDVAHVGVSVSDLFSSSSPHGKNLSASLWASRRSLRGHTALHWAAFKGHKAAVNELLDVGFDVNATSLQNASPLHLAVAADKLEVARLLMKRGADIHARTLSGSSPQTVADHMGNIEMIEALRGGG